MQSQVVGQRQTSQARPAFLARYAESLRNWANALDSTEGTIVAIARKGPRLLELLALEGILRTACLNRVISEKALPFLSPAPSTLIVVDDAVAWGSTFANVTALSKSVVGGGVVIGIPFALSERVCTEHRTTISRHFLHLRSEDFAAFVATEIFALRRIAKPADIEHPIITLVGGPFTFPVVDAILRDVATSMGGSLVAIPSWVPMETGTRDAHSWTILLSAERPPNRSFAKIRVYLDNDATRITLVAIQPHAVGAIESASLAGLPDGGPFALWERAASATRTHGQRSVANEASQRSLVTWTNYLAALPLARFAARKLTDALSEEAIDATLVSPRAFDLQLLIGHDLARVAESVLEEYFTDQRANDDRGDVDRSTSLRPPLIFKSERIPAAYATKYHEQREQSLARASDVYDALEAIFYSQHTAIELPSRTADAAQEDRLEFGITLDEIVRLAQHAVPSTTEIQIHRVLDTLIDEGAVVPRYLNMGSGESPVWVRAFRVGEGPIPRRTHALRLLCEALQAELGDDAIPAVLLEKYCVLALTGLVPDRRLDALRTLGIEREFHLYGARPYLPSGRDPRFLLDWAVHHGILSSEHGARLHQYTLRDLTQTFPVSESPWDDDTKDALEDLAALTRIFRECDGERSSNDALVTVTTLATRQDFHQATAAELRIWLHDEGHSVYRAMTELGGLVQAARDGVADMKQRLRSVNDRLAHTANVTAQVKSKTALFTQREKLYAKVDATVAGDRPAARIWKKLRVSLDGREHIEATASGLEQILSALRIAHATTRVLRELLTLAGWDDPQSRAIGLAESIKRIRDLLATPTQVDLVTRRVFATQRDHPDISVGISRLLDSVPVGFIESFEATRPIIMQIADACGEVFAQFGPDECREDVKLLPPPRYIVMWDIRGSTDRPTRDDLETLIGVTNRRINTVIGGRALDFDPRSKDDGNGLICENFKDVIATFRILADKFPPFRAGCEVNFQGHLSYYPETRRLGGRAFEHAARVAAMFKEIDTDSKRWVGDSTPAEPGASYLVVGEFARRFAEMHNEWETEGLTIHTPPGRYAARVHGALPIEVSIVTFSATNFRVGLGH